MLIHDGAFGTDAELCWAGVMTRLASDHHVLAPDLLGWGGTDKVCFFDRSPYEYRLQHIADICAALVIDEPIAFVGSSFGAELVVRGTADPTWGWKVRAAVAIAGTGGRLFRVPGGVEQLSNYTPSLAEAARLESFLVSLTGGREAEIRRRYENSLVPGHFESLSALHLRNPAVERAIPPDDWPAPLTRCMIPILFIEGEEDTLLEHGWAEKLASIALNGEWCTSPGAHEPNMDHPDEVANAVRSFLARIAETEVVA
jgi:pimeloyl-ACP methyl ester carboxylesterase